MTANILGGILLESRTFQRFNVLNLIMLTTDFFIETSSCLRNLLLNYACSLHKFLIEEYPLDHLKS